MCGRVLFGIAMLNILVIPYHLPTLVNLHMRLTFRTSTLRHVSNMQIHFTPELTIICDTVLRQRNCSKRF